MPFGQVCYEDPVSGDTTCDSGGTSITSLSTAPYYIPDIIGIQSTTPQPISTTASKGQSPLYSILAGGVTGAAQILGQRYAVPQLQAGQFIQKTPQGSVMYQLPTGGTGIGTGLPTSLTSPITGAGGLSPLLIGGVIIGVVLLVSMKKG